MTVESLLRPNIDAIALALFAQFAGVQFAVVIPISVSESKITPDTNYD
jgi:hypothetical protein